MPELVATVFLASLVGGLHCAGMCGGFVAFYAGQADVRDARWAHVAYNLGRLVTYTVLGLIAGTMGAAIDLAGHMAGLPRLAGVLAGGLVVLWGVTSLLVVFGARVPKSKVGDFLHARSLRLTAKLKKRPPIVRAGLLGLFSTFLPCGWLYAFAATAAGTGSPWQGGLVMAVFWAGTLPVLVSLGIGLQKLTGPLRRYVPVVSASALVVVGLLAVFGRLQMPTAQAHGGPGADTNGAAIEEPACHH